MSSDNTKIGESYLRIRKLLNAWDTPYGPSEEEVYEHTENCLKDVIQERNLLLSTLKEALHLLEVSWEESEEIQEFLEASGGRNHIIIAKGIDLWAKEVDNFFCSDAFKELEEKVLLK